MSDVAFAIEIDEAPETVTAGESVTLTASVEYSGDEDATETVDLVDGDGTALASEEVEFEDGATETVELEWTPGGDDVGTIQLRIRAGETEAEAGAEATAELTVQNAPAEFAVEVTAADEHIPEGGTATIEATIENTGTLSGTQDVEIAVDDAVEETHAGLELDGGDSETITYSRDTGDVEEPELTIEVSTEDDSDSASIPIVTESVTPLRKIGSQSGMGLFGWIIFALLIVLLIPLLPILALIKLLDILGGGSQPAR